MMTLMHWRHFVSDAGIPVFVARHNDSASAYASSWGMTQPKPSTARRDSSSSAILPYAAPRSVSRPRRGSRGPSPLRPAGGDGVAGGDGNGSALAVVVAPEKVKDAKRSLKPADVDVIFAKHTEVKDPLDMPELPVG